MHDLRIDRATLVLPDGLADGQTLLVADGRIARIGPTEELKRFPARETRNAEHAFLCPGFIDLHIHGTHRALVDDGPEALDDLCRILPRYGVTGFLPTVCPRAPGEDAAFLATLAEVTSEGAAILGFHLEGPFLVETGALPPEALGKADAARVEALLRAAQPYPAVFSIAPDFEGILDLLPRMRGEEGRPVFFTHTRADVAQTRAAVEAGARHATHFYDVFYAPETTEPGARPCGAAEVALADPRVTVDFILDGEHVDPVAVELALACKGPEGVALITDANVGAGLPPGRYRFPGGDVEFQSAGAPARIAPPHPKAGGLAGSGLTMDRAVRNAMHLLGLGLPDAVRMASATPARVLGREARKGRLAVGMDADLVLLDAGGAVMATWIGGVRRYAREEPLIS